MIEKRKLSLEEVSEGAFLIPETTEVNTGCFVTDISRFYEQTRAVNFYPSMANRPRSHPTQPIIGQARRRLLCPFPYPARLSRLNNATSSM
jgi:hypothetical protein